jgi:hypothetical protein
MARAATNGHAVLETLSPVSNEANDALVLELPYVAEITVEGSAALLFHRWNNEAVEAKAKAAKGSAAKKQDDVESYVYRDALGDISIPGEYFRMALVGAAKYQQDPRSPRKSAQDLFKAGVVVLDELCSLGTREWDYLDRRRVMVQRNGITRARPAMEKGWRATVRLQVLTPEYINPHLLNATLQTTGRLIGVGDFRPTYGRFQIVHFEVLQA